MGPSRAEPHPKGQNDRKADLGSIGEDCSNKASACMEWASSVWNERSEVMCPDSIDEWIAPVLSFCHY